MLEMNGETRGTGGSVPERARRWSVASISLLGPILLAAGCSGAGSFGTSSNLMLNVSPTGYQATLSAPGCPTLGDVAVMFDDEPGQVVEAGGTFRDLGGDTQCRGASLELMRTIDFTQPRSLTEVRISGSVNIRAIFEQLVGPVTLDVATSPPLAPGATITFALNPSGDTFLAAGVGPKLRWDTPAGIVPASDAQVSGGMITTFIPTTATPGDQLSFSYGQGVGVIQAKTLRCEGAAYCSGYPQVLVAPAQITVQ